jgi:hypothetical protein
MLLVLLFPEQKEKKQKSNESPKFILFFQSTGT